MHIHKHTHIYIKYTFRKYPHTLCVHKIVTSLTHLFWGSPGSVATGREDRLRRWSNTWSKSFKLDPSWALKSATCSPWPTRTRLQILFCSLFWHCFFHGVPHSLAENRVGQWYFKSHCSKIWCDILQRASQSCCPASFEGKLRSQVSLRISRTSVFPIVEKNREDFLSRGL